MARNATGQTVSKEQTADIVAFLKQWMEHCRTYRHPIIVIKDSHAITAWHFCH